MHISSITFTILFAISSVQSFSLERRAGYTDCAGNPETDPANAARLTAWVAGTAAAQTAATAQLVAEVLAEANLITDAVEREAARVLAVTVAARAAAKAVAAAIYGANMVIHTVAILCEVCDACAKIAAPPGDITGTMIASLIGEGDYLYFSLDLEGIPMGQHNFHIHHSSCGSAENPHFAHDFPALVGSYANTAKYEFATDVNDVTDHCKVLGVESLRSGLDEGGRSIILHVGGEKICGDFVEGNGGHSNYIFKFE
jgi:Cu/Zn superoxide dismutase